MTLKANFFKIFSLFLFSLSGCETIDVRGHEIDPSQLNKIKVGETTKAKVAELLGTPAAVATFNNKTWFYMSETTSTRAFFSPSVLKSNTLRIEFDEKERVKSLESLTEVDRQVVSHVYRSTPTAGHEFGVLEQIFGNVGRFNGKDPDADRKGH